MLVELWCVFSSLFHIYLKMSKDSFGSQKEEEEEEPMVSDERVTLDSSDQKSCLLTAL